MKLWGVVAEVNKKDLVISLPGGLRGLVCAADAFDPISEKEIEVGFTHISRGVTLHKTNCILWCCTESSVIQISFLLGSGA